MISPESGLERKKMIYISSNGLKSYISVCNYNMCFCIGDDSEMQIVLCLVEPEQLNQNTNTQEWVTCCHTLCLYKIDMKIPLLKEYRYVTNHLHVYVSNYYIFICTVILLLLAICHNFVNVNIS